MLLTVGVNIVCQALRENMRSSELVTSDTTPHVDKNKKPIFIFILTLPCALSRSHEWERVPCMFDPLGSHTNVIGEQNVTNHLGVGINPTAELQAATHVRRCKMPDTFDMVRIHSST
jgi:hypothetical protein